MNLVRDANKVLPLALGSRVLSVTYARSDDLLAGRSFDATLRGLLAGAGALQTARVAPDTPWQVYDSLLSAARGMDAVIVGAYVPPRSGAGSVGVPATFRTFIEGLNRIEGTGSAVISFGNPYLLSAFPGAGTYLAAWGSWEVSQNAAARAVAGAAPITGRLPVSIPPLHRLGDGLDRAVAAQTVAQAPGAPIDPLQEAGFIPGGEAGAGGQEPATNAPTGGPGRWRPADPLPACEDWSPAAALAEPGASPPTPDLASTFCRQGPTIVSPREVDPARAGLSADSLAALDDFIPGRPRRFRRLGRGAGGRPAAARSCGCADTGGSTGTPPPPRSPRPRSSTWPRSRRLSPPPPPP